MASRGVVSPDAWSRRSKKPVSNIDLDLAARTPPAAARVRRLARRQATMSGLTLETPKPGAPGDGSKAWRISKRGPGACGTPHQPASRG